jgi:VanZ family protein
MCEASGVNRAFPARSGHRYAISRRRSFLLYWLPVFLWMSVMFGMSTDIGSPRHTSRFLRPILRWFNPNVSDETIRSIQLGIRKTAHVTEYAVLSYLIWRARRKPMRGEGRPWGRGDALCAFCVAVLFALSDEWHQSFVPSREGHFRDVLFDTCGAVLGLLAAWGVGRWRRVW